MSIEYITRNDVESHEAAMQRVVEEKKRKQEAINDKKKRVIESAQQAYNQAVKEAADEADQDLAAAEQESEAELTAMQNDFEQLPLLRQVYHEAPVDLFELILSFSYVFDDYDWGLGGLNSFRLVNKRCKQVIESCTTSLVNRQEADGPDSLPIPIIQRCRRIDEIRCDSHNLRSLEGCPDGLKFLKIGNAPHISDLSLLVSCSRMKSLHFSDLSITDISVVASMPLLEDITCQKKSKNHGKNGPSIKDLSPLSACPRLKQLWLYHNYLLKDLSPLSACTILKDLEITLCPRITNLVPLSTLKKLKELCCSGIDPQTSLLPLASCDKLKKLYLYIQLPQLSSNQSFTVCNSLETGQIRELGGDSDR